MITLQSVEIGGSRDAIYELAQDVASWPRILPHYRYVRVIRESGDERVAIMAARRDWIPVRWTATQHLLPSIPRIEFTHIAGWAAGMRVAWIFDAVAGGTKVTISHDFARLRLPLLRTRLGCEFISAQFVTPIAGRTLATMKALVESRRG